MAIGPTGRADILAAVAARWLALYGPAGTTGKWFRGVTRGPVRPLQGSFPHLWVADAGQRRVEGEETESSWTKELTLQGVLHLEADWTRVATADDWTDRVSRLIADTNRYRLGGYGITRFDYVDDEPGDLVFFSGGSAAVWTVSFAIQYVEQFPA